MVLSVNNLSLALYDRTDPLFGGLSLNLDSGWIGLVTGATGSGKTMLGVTLTGCLPLWTADWRVKGDIMLRGGRVEQGHPPSDAMLVLENPATQIASITRTVRGELALPLESRGVPRNEMLQRIEWVADSFGVSRLLDRDCRTLSGGELQRVVLASALIAIPRFVYLDRPLTDLDDAFRRDVMTLIREVVVASEGAALIADDTWLIPDSARFDTTIPLLSGTRGVDIHAPSPEKYDIASCATNEERLTLKNVSFGYNGSACIRDVSFTLGGGELLFVTGPNGAGKTTLARLITGILAPDSGSITIGGVPGKTMAEYVRFGAVGYALQNPDLQLCRASVRAELELAAAWGHPADRMIEPLGIAAFLDRHPLELTQAGKKRLGMVLAASGERNIVIFDEPSQYQDRSGLLHVCRGILACLSEGMAVVVITHDRRLLDSFPGAGIIRLFREDTA